MNNLKSASLVASAFLLASSTVSADLFEGHQKYISAGSEYYEWVETTDDRESNFVSEYGPRLKFKFDSNNWYTKDKGRLSNLTTSIALGYVSYHGLSQTYHIDELESDTFYFEHDTNIGQGYRYKLNEESSLDIKGYLGIKYWIRWVMTKEAYSPSEDEMVDVGLTERYLDIYAKTGIAYNYSLNKSDFTIEAGVFRPLETIEYCNCSSEYLYPKPDWGQYVELTYLFDKKYFTRAYYEGLEYQESEINDDNYYQPTSKYKKIGVEIGMRF